MTYPQIISDLKAKKYQPIYFLYGEESYYIDKITEFIESNVLSESERAFNQMVFYGKETDHKTLIDAACRYPMMAPYQVIILKEAQDMKALKEIQPYIEKPVPTTILVICHKHKKIDGRSKFAQAVKKNALSFESRRIYDNQMADWIKAYLKAYHLTIDNEAANLIGEYLGTDLSKVTNELDKLALNVARGSQVTVQQVQDNIGISKDYNIFELQKALSQRDVLQANRILQYFISNPRKNPLVLVIGSLYNFFSRVYMLHFLRNTPDREILDVLKLRSDWFLREYRTAARHYNLTKTQEVLAVLKEYDLKSKGVNSNNTPEGSLLREMVFKILH